MSRFRNVCFTLNNPSDEELEKLRGFFRSDDCSYGCFQMERGENGTPHAQGYFELTKQVRANTLKTMVGRRVHLEARRGTRDQARAYCRKADTRISEPEEFGEWRGSRSQGKRNDIVCAKEMLDEGKSMLDVFESVPASLRHFKALNYYQSLRCAKKGRNLEKKVEILWGRPGVGKTRAIMDKFGDENVFLPIVTKDKVWFDGWNGQQVVLFDDFYGSIRYSWLLKFCDIYAMPLETKGGSFVHNFAHVYFTSNKDPREWYDGIPDTTAFFRRVTRIRNIVAIGDMESSSSRPPQEEEQGQC